MSSEDYASRSERYMTSHASRVGISLLFVFGYFGFVVWAIYRWLGIGEVWWGAAAYVAALLVGCAIWLWYCFSHSPAVLHRKYGLLCPSCDAWLAWTRSGKPGIENGTCAKCGCQIIDIAVEGPLRPYHWPSTRRLVVLIVGGLVLCSVTVVILIRIEHAGLFRGVTGTAFLWLLGIVFCLLAKRASA